MARSIILVEIFGCDCALQHDVEDSKRAAEVKD